MKWMFLVPACVAALAVSTVSASANDTGLAGIHDLRREGKKLCMSDHFHNGNSAAQSSKAAALQAAISSWAGFTSLEYGSAWASFKKAASKQVTCTQGSSGWGCDINARPCK